MIRDLTSRGVSIVYISHHLEEALQITDHAVVLRDGAMTAYAPRKDIDLEWIVRNMVGENFDLGSPPDRLREGRRRACDREPQRARSAGGGYSVGRPPVARRAGRRDRLHLRADGRRTHRDDGVRRGPAALPRAGGFCCTARTSRASASPSASPPAWCWCPEDRQRDGLVQTMTVGPEPVARQHRRLHQAASSPRASASRS